MEIRPVSCAVALRSLWALRGSLPLLASRPTPALPWTLVPAVVVGEALVPAALGSALLALGGVGALVAAARGDAGARAWAAAFAAAGARAWLFPPPTPGRPRLRPAARREWAALFLALTRRGCGYNVGAGTTILESREDSLLLRFECGNARRNFLASAHGGFLASCVDVATSLALLQRGAFSGVSVSLRVTYFSGCGPGDAVVAEARVLRAGSNLAFTECDLRRESDGVLMARGTHVKYVRAPFPMNLLVAARPSLLARLLKRAAGRAPPAPPPAAEAPHDATTETDTGLPRDDAGKRVYFAAFGDGRYPMQGWDRPLDGALALTRPYVDDAHPVEWTLVVGAAHANSYGALHGGCAASLVDVLGSAAVAAGDERECGVAVSVDCAYASAAKVGSTLVFSATVAKRGRRLVTVNVEARHAKTGKLVCYGAVTKSLRGQPR